MDEQYASPWLHFGEPVSPFDGPNIFPAPSHGPLEPSRSSLQPVGGMSTTHESLPPPHEAHPGSLPVPLFPSTSTRPLPLFPSTSTHPSPDPSPPSLFPATPSTSTRPSPHPSPPLLFPATTSTPPLPASSNVNAPLPQSLGAALSPHSNLSSPAASIDHTPFSAPHLGTTISHHTSSPPPPALLPNLAQQALERLKTRREPAEDEGDFRPMRKKKKEDKSNGETENDEVRP